MIIRKGTGGSCLTHQDAFSPTTKCICGGESRMAFVAMEDSEEEFYICDLHKNGEKGEFGGFWPHDAIAVAVYFCRKCAKPVVLYNQG